MILVFGGTTEGRRVAGVLNGLSVPFIYSTKTPGKALGFEWATQRVGALETPQLEHFCRQQHIRLIVDAAHPFANQLRQTIEEVSLLLGLPVLHFERNFSHTQHILFDPYIHKVKSFEHAIKVLFDLNPKMLLATTGVQSLPKLKPYWQKLPMLIRILPQPRSIELAQSSGFPPEHTLACWPSKNAEQELQLIKKYGIDCVLSKESGESGLIAQKIQAAKQSQIPIIIIERPLVPPSFYKVSQKSDFIELLKKLYLQCQTKP